MYTGHTVELSEADAMEEECGCILPWYPVLPEVPACKGTRVINFATVSDRMCGRDHFKIKK